MALRANRPNPNGTGTGATTGATTGAPASTEAGTQVPQGNTTPAPIVNTNVPATTVGAQVGAPLTGSNMSAQISNLNSDILGNIDGMGNAGNFVSMDGSEFFYKSLDLRVPSIDLIITSGKRYYQWVEEIGDSKTFHDSDTKLNDFYKLKFEIHWEEEVTEGDITEPQFHMPTASAMRFIDYVKALAQSGYGVGNVVTRMTVSRQVQKNSTNRYSRAEFTMVGFVNAQNEIVDVPNGITTVGKK